MTRLSRVVAVLIVCLKQIRADFNDVNDLIIKADNLIESSQTYTFPKNNAEYFENQINNLTIDYGLYDFIIVGGGTAGGVVANRLTEKSFRVLVIEAGSEAPDISAVIGLSPYLTDSEWNWGFNTTPQSNSCLGYTGRQCSFPSGKGLGGSSIINDGYYVRGNSKDYDDWAQITGDSSWTFENVLPYFKKSESANYTTTTEDATYRGYDGPQGVAYPEDIPRLTLAQLQGFQEINLVEVDYNGQSQLGYGRKQSYLSNNIRSSTNYSFIRPAIERPNLFISTNSLVVKVVIKDQVAVGVEFVKNGQRYRANASNEVLVSAGAISSPQILMLSGLGPADELERLGIDVIANLPIGQNLQDHIASFYIRYTSDKVIFQEDLNRSIALWVQDRGLLLGNAVVAFVDFNNDTVPDIQYALTEPYTVDASDSITIEGFDVVLMLLHPTSVGNVTLKSSNPRDYPLINTNFFIDGTDLERLYQGHQLALELNSTSAYRHLGLSAYLADVPECDDVHERLSKNWWFCNLRYNAIPSYHGIGTTRMGRNPTDSVVDSNLKVHGIDRLRVIDAGIIPAMLSGNLNAAVVMIAEKISDVIKADYR